ncbi:trehalase family glycosidase [Coraliomargarita sp. SDUM461004]|uniref:Trehalase family glycosidase n=1 Tax=Thalassobacterium sedimentorum TaxID=3041258 RepID=A0ABU1AJE5_9BACT|nr:trehalase family glycosidase [Coraliomargarita sp. SDUM461004]MDQ8194764.1 trehalase family glycosidase [Coraliomargarita sp. SDUM461004]
MKNISNACLISRRSLVPPASTWHSGNIIAFSHLDGLTDYRQGIIIRTTKDGLSICHPAELQLSFTLTGPIIESRITNDWFEVYNENGESIRGVLIDAHHLLLEGPIEFKENAPELLTFKNGDKTLIGNTTHFSPKLINLSFDSTAAERLHWLQENKIHGRNVTEKAQYSFIRALSQMKGQVCSPEGKIQSAWTTPDRWPHRNMWLWDSAFHAIGWRHIAPQLAQEMLSAMLSVQNADGFIPHMASPDECSEITQPPVLALAAQLVFEKSQDTSWLETIYPQLCAYVDWNAAHRDKDGAGLLEWYIEDNPDCRSGESGMDNSPRFDKTIALDATDFNAYQAGEYEILAQFASQLGMQDEALKWETHHKDLCSKINEKLWSETDGLYLDLDQSNGKLSKVFSSSSFLPLYCGAPDARRASRLAEHLTNPNTFGTAFPVPSVVSSDTESFYSKDMWRGPTWININWMIARGLRRYGYNTEAEMIRTKTLAEIERTCKKWGTFFEYFDDKLEVEPPALLRKGKNIPRDRSHQVVHDYGWTATLYIDWLLNEE